MMDDALLCHLRSHAKPGAPEIWASALMESGVTAIPLT